MWVVLVCCRGMWIWNSWGEVLDDVERCGLEIDMDVGAAPAILEPGCVVHLDDAGGESKSQSTPTYFISSESTKSLTGILVSGLAFVSWRLCPACGDQVSHSKEPILGRWTDKQHRGGDNASHSGPRSPSNTLEGGSCFPVLHKDNRFLPTNCRVYPAGMLDQS